MDLSHTLEVAQIEQAGGPDIGLGGEVVDVLPPEQVDVLEQQDPDQARGRGGIRRLRRGEAAVILDGLSHDSLPAASQVRELVEGRGFQRVRDERGHCIGIRRRPQSFDGQVDRLDRGATFTELLRRIDVGGRVRHEIQGYHRTPGADGQRNALTELDRRHATLDPPAM